MSTSLLNTPAETVEKRVGRAPATGRCRPRAFRHLRGYMFLVPCLIAYGGFLIWPLLNSLYLSFTDWNGLTPRMNFVGLANYVRFFLYDEVARTALLNNLIWTVATVAVPTAIGLLLAVALNERIRGRLFFRSVFYAPGVLPLVGVALIWSWLYSPDFGLVNEFLRTIGLHDFARPWLGDPNTALFAVVVAGIWVRTGLPMLLYLAGLQAIPRDRYEAARVDGAGPWHIFRHVTMPGLRETHVVVISLTLVDALKVFDLIYAMTYGGPGNATQVPATWMYFNTFQFYKAGYGSAIAIIIAVLSIAVAIPYIMILRKRAS